MQICVLNELKHFIVPFIHNFFLYRKHKFKLNCSRFVNILPLYYNFIIYKRLFFLEYVFLNIPKFSKPIIFLNCSEILYENLIKHKRGLSFFVLLLYRRGLIRILKYWSCYAFWYEINSKPTTWQTIFLHILTWKFSSILV